jgi:hypothetical protein
MNRKLFNKVNGLLASLMALTCVSSVAYAGSFEVGTQDGWNRCYRSDGNGNILNTSPVADSLCTAQYLVGGVNGWNRCYAADEKGNLLNTAPVADSLCTTQYIVGGVDGWNRCYAADSQGRLLNTTPVADDKCQSNRCENAIDCAQRLTDRFSPIELLQGHAEASPYLSAGTEKMPAAERERANSTEHAEIEQAFHISGSAK